MKAIYHHKLMHSKVPVRILILAGATALAGCQSTTVPTSINGSTALIDYSIANFAQNQAQSRAFNKSLNDNAARYDQLFDEDKFPNNDQQAKQRLMLAIRQHMATEHVAVAKAHYQANPFIDADSIDNGASSLLRTIFEIYAYRESGQYDYLYSSQDELDDAKANLDAAQAIYDANPEYFAELAAIATANAAIDDEILAEKAARFNADYEVDGIEYDVEGYDIEGFDVEGYDHDGYDYYGLDSSGYDADGYDYDGYDQDGYDREGNYEYSDNDDDQNIRERIANNGLKDFLVDYEAMKAQQLAKSQNGVSNNSRAYPGSISLILGMIHKTPEQVEAMNAYNYKYLTFNSVSHYKPKERQFQSVYSYDYVAPTISSSIQIPLAFDFNNSRITLDPAAFMPIIALAAPKNTPLPNEMMSNTFDFGLPEIITSQLPSAVVYDAAIKAMQDSMAEIKPDQFSAIDIRQDNFAKQAGANHAVKINFDSQQTGELVGRMFKNMSQSLQEYVDANPEQYPDGALLKTAIDKIQLYNQGYQSADMGSLLQLIEAILPISFNQINYYYLNNANELVGKQQRINIGSDLMGSQTTVLNQVRYDRKLFNESPLTPLLAQSFGANAAQAIDGNAWFSKQQKQNARLQTARFERYDYTYDDDSSNYDNSSNYDDLDNDSYNEE